MSDSLKQNQKAGDHSQNLQAQTINITGITVAEARQIALDVFKANAMELAGTARELFERRGREFIERYLDELQRRKPDGLSALKDPDMQYALFVGQQGYARSGSEALGVVLLDLLIERASASPDSLMRIALNESVGAVSKLTPGHWDLLSFLFLVRSGKLLTAETVGEVADYINQKIIPFVSDSTASEADRHHIECVGCATTDWSLASTFVGWLREAYAGIFSAGFEVSRFHELLGESHWAQI